MFEYEINSSVGKFFILSDKMSLSYVEIAAEAAKWGIITPNFTFSIKRRYVG